MFVDVNPGKTDGIGTLDLGILGTHQIGEKTGSHGHVRRAVPESGAVLSAARPRCGRDHVRSGCAGHHGSWTAASATRSGWDSWRSSLPSRVGIPLGVVAALRQNTYVDYSATFLSTIGISVPGFVMGILLIFVLASGLKLIPVIPQSWNQAGVWVIPIIVLGFGTLAGTARLTRTSMLEVMRQDYIRTARAKGLPERTVVIHHMLRNALIPVVTDAGAGAGLFDHRLIYHRDHVQFSGHRPRVCHRDLQSRLLHDHGDDVDLCGVDCAGELERGPALRLAGSAHQSGRVTTSKRIPRTRFASELRPRACVATKESEEQTWLLLLHLKTLKTMNFKTFSCCPSAATGRMPGIA